MKENKLERFSYLSNAEGEYLNSLYEKYLEDPNSVEESWKRFFEGYEMARKYDSDQKDSSLDKAPKPLQSGPTPSDSEQIIQQSPNVKGSIEEVQVHQLIETYRSKGHLAAKLDPLALRPQQVQLFELNRFGLSSDKLNDSFEAIKDFNSSVRKLCDGIELLKKLYCGTIGIEYMHIRDPNIKNWLQEKFELSKPFYRENLSIEKRKHILKKLNESSVFENFLHTKYIGQKRFSLEGGENTITGVDAIINKAADLGCKEVVIGMAHRGRLNILTNIIGKSYEEIFSEFEGRTIDLERGDGDVKYHLGHSSKVVTTNGQEMVLKLMPNPSHLEVVGPVVQGYTRAKAEILYNEDYQKIIPIQIHGDAAISGQGVVYEILQMSELKGYTTGGTIHFIINNQIGFTTEPHDSRSADYCTSIAWILDCPVLHVNGDDAEAVVFCCELATEFRHQFGKDIFIDMVSYRKYGHNESDEPRYTQPKIYEVIDKHPGPREWYSQRLISQSELAEDLAKSMQQEFKHLLQDRLNQIKQTSNPSFEQFPDLEWKSLRNSRPEDFFQSPKTCAPMTEIEDVIKALTILPEGFEVIPKASKILESRKTMIKEGKVDWALAEQLAYGTLLIDGHYIRLSGQDAGRGTFSHRHAIFYNKFTAEPYIPLNNIREQQAKFRVINSPLSEFAVLGYEYGYSLGRPNNLTIWEAQFGDFSNGAQSIIDQFISSAESKWQSCSGIVLLLPHGYEGQGPEHSSARPERYLQLCAEFNLIVANCTTPQNFFHVLRRQLKYEFRKPLVILSPKSLLRHPQCISPIEGLVKEKFEEIIDDPFIDEKDLVRKVILCTGKIFYDLFAYQQKFNRKDVAIIRLEQLHPIPFDKVDSILRRYSRAKYAWVQEEPKNMGYWNYILRKLDYYDLDLVSRKSSASTATGYAKVHKKEQEEIIRLAFA